MTLTAVSQCFALEVERDDVEVLSSAIPRPGLAAEPGFATL
jgi:hypothetical protein